MRDIIVLTISRQKLSTVLPIKKNKNVTLKKKSCHVENNRCSLTLTSNKGNGMELNEHKKGIRIENKGQRNLFLLVASSV